MCDDDQWQQRLECLICGCRPSEQEEGEEEEEGEEGEEEGEEEEEEEEDGEEEEDEPGQEDITAAVEVNLLQRCSTSALQLSPRLRQPHLQTDCCCHSSQFQRHPPAPAAPPPSKASL